MGDLSACGTHRQTKRQRQRKISEEQQQELVGIIIDKSPLDFDCHQIRWTLALFVAFDKNFRNGCQKQQDTLLKAKVPFLKVYQSVSGIFYLLSAARLAWIRCRDVVVSVDPLRDYKIRRNRRLLGYVCALYSATAFTVRALPSTRHKTYVRRYPR